MRRLVKAFALVTILSCVTRFISFLFKIFLSRWLGAELLGIYQITFSLFALFLSVASSGIPVTLSRMTAEQNSLSNNSAINSIFTTSLLLSLMISGTIITVIICFPSILSYLFSDGRCCTLFWILLPMLITSTLYSVIRGWFWGKKQFFIFSVTELVEEIIKIILTTTLLLTGIFGIGKFYSYAVAMLLTDILLVIILAICFIYKGGRLGKPLYTSNIVRSATPLTITRIFGSLMSTFLSLSIPMLLSTKCGLSTTVATAQFGRASGMVMPLIFAPSSIVGSLGVVLIPEIAGRSKTTSCSQVRNKIGHAIEFSCIVSCFFFVLFSACGKNLASILYNDTLAGEYLAKACVLMIPMCVNSITISILNSLGKENQTFLSHIVCCVALAIVTLIVPKYLGIMAYFVALFVFHSLGCIINLTLLSKNIGMTSTTVNHSLSALISALGLGLCMVSVSDLLTKKCGTYLSLFISSAIAIVVYISFLTLTKIINIKDLYKKNKPYSPRMF